MVNSVQFNGNYLICLDSLFDTRLGVVTGLGESAIMQLVESDYSKREDDSCLHAIPGYLQAWATRSITTLMQSHRTVFVSTVVDLLLADVNDKEIGLPDRKFNLYINTWPYSLDETSKVELVNILTMLLQNRVTVTCRSYSPQMLSPKTILSNNFTLVALYNFEEWIKLHFEALYSSPLKEVVFVAPMLREINARELPEVTAEMSEVMEKYSPFECVELSLMEVLALKYYPIQEYCGVIYDLVTAKKEG